MQDEHTTVEIPALGLIRGPNRRIAGSLRFPAEHALRPSLALREWRALHF